MFKKAQSLGEKRKKMNGNVKQNKPKKNPLCPSDVTSPSTKAKMHCDHFCNLK